MHIAIDARIINSSTGRYIERLLTYLEKIENDHTYSVLVRAKDKDYWKPTDPRFTIVVADFHQYTFEEQLGLNTLLRRLKPDLVHFCMPQQPLLYTGLKVTTVHDLSLLRITQNDDMPGIILAARKFIFKHLLKRVLSQSQFIITPSDYTKDDILAFKSIDPNRIVRTYESADAVADHEEPVAEFIGKDFIIAVGRSEPYKNLYRLIKAHNNLLETHPDLQLILIGKRDQNSHFLEAMAKENGCGKNVTYFGFASDEQLAWFYSHARAYVFPSLMEGFGLPGLEAMKHGAPVVSSNATCLPEIYGNAARYFDPLDIHSITESLDMVLTDTKFRNQLIERGTKKVAEYSWRRMAEQTLEIYDRAAMKTAER